MDISESVLDLFPIVLATGGLCTTGGGGGGAGALGGGGIDGAGALGGGGIDEAGALAGGGIDGSSTGLIPDDLVNAVSLELSLLFVFNLFC